MSTGSENLHGFDVDGRVSLRLIVPVMLLVCGVVGGTVFVVGWKVPDLLAPCSAGLTAAFAVVSAWYARKAIELQRKVAITAAIQQKTVSQEIATNQDTAGRRRATLEFSARYSTDPLLAARDIIYSKYQEHFIKADGKSDEDKRYNAVTALSQSVLDALDRRGTDDLSESDQCLISSVRMISDYFEDLAVGVEFGVYDEEVSRALLRTPLIKFWDYCSVFCKNNIDKQKQTTAVEYAQKLAESWSQKN